MRTPRWKEHINVIISSCAQTNSVNIFCRAQSLVFMCTDFLFKCKNFLFFVLCAGNFWYTIYMRKFWYNFQMQPCISLACQPQTVFTQFKLWSNLVSLWSHVRWKLCKEKKSVWTNKCTCTNKSVLARANVVHRIIAAWMLVRMNVYGI